jgi:hypothetical protein
MSAYIPIIFGTIAMFMGTIANIGCASFQFTSDRDERLYVGLWSYRTSVAIEFNNNVYIRAVCANYEYLEDEYDYEVDFDQKENSIRALGITAPVLGGIFCILVCISPCCPVKPALWKLGGLFAWIVCIFQGLTMMALESDICKNNPALGFVKYLQSEIFDDRDVLGEFPDECSWASGFRIGISSVVFWFIAGLSMLVLPAPAPILYDDSAPAAGASGGEEEEGEQNEQASPESKEGGESLDGSA